MTVFDTTSDDFETLDACPLCGAHEESWSEITDRGDRFQGERAVICRRCGLVFLSPRLHPEALGRYYRSDAFSQEVRGEARPSEAALAYRDMRAERRWRLLERVLPRGGRCLEIGCGAGNFLGILERAGYEATGVDPSSGYVAYAREAGLNAIEGRFPDVPADDVAYDLVFIFHVLEHVPDPGAMLDAVRRVLAPGGSLILEYPDVELAARRRFLPTSYFERAHLFDFSRHTLEAFLARCGFQVREALLDEPRKPYDRNVLLVCEAEEPRPPAAWSPDRAQRLERALRRRLALSRPLMPLRPLWRRLKRMIRR